MASVTHLPIRFSDGTTMPRTPALIKLGQELRERAERENWNGSSNGSATHKRYLHASLTTQESAAYAFNEAYAADS